MEQPILIGPFTALVVSSLVTFAVWRSAMSRQILIDAPNERSSHARPKPRGGGLGVIAGLLAGSAVVAVSYSFDRSTLLLLLGALAYAAIGLWDDLRGLSVGPRLLAQFTIASLFVLQSGPLLRFPLPAPLDVPLGIFGFVFPVVWLVGVTNFFNFMDGLDGLAAGQGIAVCLMIAVAAWSVDARWIALVLLAALVGFIPFNWWPSRIFLGDVGSLPIGFVLAGLPLLAPPEDRSRAVLATAICLTLFLLDPVLILFRRWRRGARLGEAHREHLYQSFLQPGDPHGVVTTILVAVGLGLAFAGWISYASPGLGWPGVALAVLAFATEGLLAGRKGLR